MSLRLLTLACVVTFSITGGQAQANSTRSRVTLVRAAGNDRLLREASTRLQAELVGAGFEVTLVERAPDAQADPRSAVESAAEGGTPFATIALERARFGAFADVWISDHLTGKTVVRRIDVVEASNASNVLAIRALELLRASLLEVSEPRRETEPTIDAPADVRAFVEPALPARAPHNLELARAAALGVSAFGLVGTGSLGLAAGPCLRLSQGFGGPWFGRLSLMGPLLGPEAVGAHGQASVRQELGSAEIGLASVARPFGLLGWIGLGGYHLRTVGSSAAPYRARSDDVVSLAASAGVGGVARISSRVLLSAELGALWLTPYPVVMIAGKAAGAAGLPSLSMALGVMVGL
jgi:hypothetical protein